MKKFHFTLRAVGVVRAHKERLAREALSVAMAARAAAESRLADAQRSVLALEAQMRAVRSGGVRPMDVVAAQEAHRRELLVIEQMRKQLAVAHAEFERCRQLCIEANRQVKVIERLENDARQAHRAASLKSEQAEFDEMAGHRAAHKALST